MTAPPTAAGAVLAGAVTLSALDSAYREALARTSAGVVRILLARWPMVRVDDLAGSSDRFLDDAVAAALAGRRNAVQLANAYTTSVRRLTAPGAPPFSPPPAAPPSEEQIRSSFEFTAIKTPARKLYQAKVVAAGEKATRDVDPSGFAPTLDPADQSLEGMKQRIMADAIAAASGTAVRQVTTAGMDQLKANVQADAVAIGWYRTTKPGCCFFCAMLASRGLVYKENSFEASNARFKGPGEQKVHDRCGCGLRPVYSEDDELPDQTAEFEQLWMDAATGSGKEAILNFRRAYEGRRVGYKNAAATA